MQRPLVDHWLNVDTGLSKFTSLLSFILLAASPTTSEPPSDKGMGGGCGDVNITLIALNMSEMETRQECYEQTTNEVVDSYEMAAMVMDVNLFTLYCTKHFRTRTEAL